MSLAKPVADDFMETTEDPESDRDLLISAVEKAPDHGQRNQGQDGMLTRSTRDGMLTPRNGPTRSKLQSGTGDLQAADTEEVDSTYPDVLEDDDENEGTREDFGLNKKAKTSINLNFVSIQAKRRRCCSCYRDYCKPGSMFHYCYVILFFCYAITFPLWLKWIVSSPMPLQYWYMDYDPFPPIPFQYLRMNMSDYIDMSPIPSFGGCNYSCSSWRGYKTNEMNFEIRVSLQAFNTTQMRAYNTYPITLASEDFHSWYVVASDEDASPTPYFDIQDTGVQNIASPSYFHVTDRCISPPEPQQEVITTGPGYLLTCVVWTTDKLAWHMNSSNLTREELGQYCDAVGGVCGWPCGSGLDGSVLPGCDDGMIRVSPTTVAGFPVPNASFNASVTIQTCEGDEDVHAFLKAQDSAAQTGKPPRPDEPQCVGSTRPVGLWNCRECQANVTGKQFIYESLPRLGITLRNKPTTPGPKTTGRPHAFVMYSRLHSNTLGPEASFKGGRWIKLYQPWQPPTNPGNATIIWPVKPQPIASLDDPIQALPTAPPNDVEESMLSTMTLQERRQLTIRPRQCVGKRGPMYVVTCAVNQSVFDNDFRFKNFQTVGPPPFNDRCIVVSGRCGYACMDTDASLPYCIDGRIPQEYLVQPLRAVTNKSLAVYLFTYALIIGFAVKAMMLCPGIFQPYSHFKVYEPELTDQFRYIAVCIPSGAENKATVLRNMIGAVSCMPRNIRCRYHVIFADEGHRSEMKSLWHTFTDVISAIPYVNDEQRTALQCNEENIKTFFIQWCEETKKMDLNRLDDGGKKVIAEDVIRKMSGKTTIEKLKKECGWIQYDLKPLEAACDALEKEVLDKSKVKLDLHLDDIKDWAPPEEEDDTVKDRPGRQDRAKVVRPHPELMLRLHYVARAKPAEDERTVKAQHVAQGGWFYRCPMNACLDDWLHLRRGAQQYEAGVHEPEQEEFFVPLQTSRGKAGGLNFCKNYLTWYAEQPENRYGDDRDFAPSIFAICDARHQFQPDYMHTTLPYFFTHDGELDMDVAFTQCPQFFHELQDQCDYLDNNNAQFFRFNCMVRNCCGGVSSCGTNGTWCIRHLDGASMWESIRVKGFSKLQLFERQIFHETCKVEDTASSLDAVLKGRRSQYINRRLSYGMAKNPTDYLAAVQRWAEGGVVLSLQTFFSFHAGTYMIWFAWLTWLAFVTSLIAMVHIRSTSQWVSVQMGILTVDRIEAVLGWVHRPLHELVIYYNTKFNVLHPSTVDDYASMGVGFIAWIFMTMIVYLGIGLFTFLMKLLPRKSWITIPREMRWWARVLIVVDNLTYFLWWWSAFFWVGFNFAGIFFKLTYHFDSVGMLCFTIALQVLNWSLVIASTLRYTTSQSMEANEIMLLSMDNIWRGTQLFYITAPLMLYSIIMGTVDYMKYKFYHEDISFWLGGDRGETSKNLVKAWTLFLLCLAVVSWAIYLAGISPNGTDALGSVLVLQGVALDVLHPCTYLWLDGVGLNKEEAKELKWWQKVTYGRWWGSVVRDSILNERVTAILKWNGPVQNLLWPALMLVLPALGANAAFILLNTR